MNWKLLHRRTYPTHGDKIYIFVTSTNIYILLQRYTEISCSVHNALNTQTTDNLRYKNRYLKRLQIHLIRLFTLMKEIILIYDFLIK